MQGEAERSNFPHYMILFTCCLIIFCSIGLEFMAAGVFFPAVMGALGITNPATLSLWITIAALTNFFVLPLAGRLIATKDMRVLLTVAISMEIAAFVLFAFGVMLQTVLLFYAGGLLTGLGFGITGYMAVPTLINRWFKKKSGTMLGIAMAFGGIGGVVGNLLAGSIIQRSGAAQAYLVFAGLTALLTLPFIWLFVRSFPADKNLRPFGDTGEDMAADAGDAALQISGVSAKVARRSPAFFAMLGVAAVIAFAATFSQFTALYANSLPLMLTVPAILALLPTFATLGHTIGNVVIGIAGDKSPMGATAACLALASVGVLVLWLVPVSPVLIYAGGFLLGIFFAAGATLIPILTRAQFGVREFPQIFASVTQVSSIVSALAAVGWGLIIAGGFTSSWILLLVFFAAAGLLTILALRSAKTLSWEIEAA